MFRYSKPPIERFYNNYLIFAKLGNQILGCNKTVDEFVLFQVLAMDQSEFDDYKQQDGWSDTDDECDTSDGCLSDCERNITMS